MMKVDAGKHLGLVPIINKRKIWIALGIFLTPNTKEVDVGPSVDHLEKILCLPARKNFLALVHITISHNLGQDDKTFIAFK